MNGEKEWDKKDPKPHNPDLAVVNLTESRKQ